MLDATRSRPRHLLRLLAALPFSALLATLAVVPAHAAVITHVIAGTVSLGTAGNFAGADAVTVKATQYQNPSNVVTGQTDASGHYALAVPTNVYTNAKYYVTFTVNGPSPVYANMTWPDKVRDELGVPVDVSAGDRRDISITLPGPQQLSGVITLGDGTQTAAAGEVAVRYSINLGTNLWVQQPGVAYTDANGRYSFPSVLPQYVRIWAQYLGTEGYQDRAWTTVPGSPGDNNYPLGATGTTTADILLPDTVTVSGRVSLERAGQYASAGEISVTVTATAAFGDTQTATVTTDAAGRYSVPGLISGSYEIAFVDAAGDDWLPASTSASLPSWTTSSVVSDVTLAPDTSIEGTVTDSHGAAVPYATVYADVYDADSGELLAELEDAVDASGAYRIAGLPSGDVELYAVEVTYQHMPTAWDGRDIYEEPDLIQVGHGTHLEDYDFVLPVTAVLFGRVQVPGAPVDLRDVTVEVLTQDPGSGAWLPTGDVVGADVDGWYGIALPPRSFRFAFSYDGPFGVSKATSPVILINEGDDRRFDIVLPSPELSEETLAFIRALYQDFLDREPEWWEFDDLGRRLTAGQVSWYGAATDLSRSDEWITTVITAFYRDTLNREPDAAGLSGWVRAAQSGMPIAQIAAAFYSSQEYFQTVGNSDYTTWVTDLYQKLLLRAPDAAGLRGWVRALQGGASRDSVATGFYQSPEKLGVRITALYEQLLGRDPEPGAVQHWSPFVASNGDLVLAAAIAGSQEYFNRAQLPPSTP